MINFLLKKFLFTDPAEIIQIRASDQDQDQDVGKYEYYVHYDGCKSNYIIYPHTRIFLFSLVFILAAYQTSIFCVLFFTNRIKLICNKLNSGIYFTIYTFKENTRTESIMGLWDKIFNTVTVTSV